MDVETSKFSGEIDEGFGVLFEAASKNLNAVVVDSDIDVADKLQATQIQGNLADTLARIVAAQTIADAIGDLAKATREQTAAVVAATEQEQQMQPVTTSCPECGVHGVRLHKLDCNRSR